MTDIFLTDIPQTQRERLRFIDFRLNFLGNLNRNDLIGRFGIKEAAATRDISAYREMRPENAGYDSVAKTYTKTQSFKSLFSYDSRQVLNTLASGIGDDAVIEQRALIPCETPNILTNPDVNILATLTNAIALKKGVKIKYLSLKSGDSEREIFPFTLIDNGLRWHIRAFDRKRERFSDFVLTRVTAAQLTDNHPLEHERRGADIQWNRIVELDLVPHPAREYGKAVELDYQMTDGVRNVKIRAAVAGYLLRLWNVDCSKDHGLEGAEYHLWLRNTLALYGVENARLAPGYVEETNASSI